MSYIGWLYKNHRETIKELFLYLLPSWMTAILFIIIGIILGIAYGLIIGIFIGLMGAIIGFCVTLPLSFSYAEYKGWD